MPFLVRKINKAKWMQNDIISGHDVSADAITNCMKTSQNALSTWEITHEDDVANAVLAIVAGHQYLDTIDVVLLDPIWLKNMGINLKSSPGNTPVKELVNNHIDICNLTYHSLGSVAENIVRSFKEEKIKRYTRGDIKRLLSDAVKAGRLEKKDLYESIRNALSS